ncbi:MAG: hypothetical protein AAFY56_15865, partial [Pseudomonadota bacterium]
MSASTTVRAILGVNAAFSALVGTDLIFMPGTISQIMFANPPHWAPMALRLLGVGLFIFALDLVFMATNRFVTRGEIILIVLADIGWLVASAFFLLFGGHLFTDIGILIIGIVAAFVALFAIGQYLGARKIVPPASTIRMISPLVTKRLVA